VIVGLVRAVWHGIPDAQAGRSPAWIAGQFLSTVALRVLFVWIFNSTGRGIFAAILTYDMANVSEFMFPVNGSHDDPLIAGTILAVTAAIVAALRGPRTLARFRAHAGARRNGSVTGRDHAHRHTPPLKGRRMFRFR
jgi:hypothetical protein